LGIQREAADFLGAGKIFDLLHGGHIRTLTPFFHVPSARGPAGEEDIVAKMKESLLSPEWTVLDCLGHRGQEQNEANKCGHNAQSHMLPAERYDAAVPLQYNAWVRKIDKRALSRSCDDWVEREG
jgi:hypothetical protein